ncbi:PD-(D/E)XK motif protein [Paenibacillus anseongense]|uniref:PD-(D/E)XK motif protein n=1 Tax=Paenibacillus anseongense TaxID=2682845 RepID=UPI002DB56CDC|nr:PD-(D/E)XK motif protein [Paenibacillus anseongense]MEC0269711.1 PD-(D/E)XK motif protein [Paenibacillus anseongense]
MINDLNPWSNMSQSSQRRAISDSPHNLFWVTDLSGRYGFCIQTKDTLIETSKKINLKGITIATRKLTTKENEYELFLILNDTDDWQIFNALCQNLITVIKHELSNRKMISALEIRLKRWQQILKQERQVFTLEQQMGLFSELLCLKNVVSEKVGIREAIHSWGGPDSDKQDFLLSNCVIEVKSHRTSKGEIASISSLQQLDSKKEPFYLLSYALTNSEMGKSVEDISKEIKELLIQNFIDQVDIFENKLIQYGYIPELIKEPLHKFVVDTTKMYSIQDSFPRIVPGLVEHQVTSVHYTINLSQCSEFEVSLKNFLGD